MVCGGVDAEMADPTAASLLAATKWSVSDDLWFDEFARTACLPHLALVTKGQYLSMGAPNVASPGLKPYLFVHSVRRMRKVLAQAVRFKDGKGKTLTDTLVAIPHSYHGFFELVSEDGRPVKCLESVAELCHKFPEQCIVRQNCKGHLPDSDGELRSLCRSRSLLEGEILTLVGKFNFRGTMFLRCFDESGASVYLKLANKGRFSAVAAPDSIVGVHSVENLMTKRLPLTVRLIQGDLPAELYRSAGAQSLTFQLRSCFSEEVAFVCSLEKDRCRFAAVPMTAHLRVAPPHTHERIRRRADFDELARRCEVVAADLFAQMALVDGHSATAPRADARLSADGAVIADDDGQPAVRDEEIEQLYDYIRGLAPLPESHNKSNRQKKRTRQPKEAPPPPPVETIPSRKSRSSSGSARSGGDKDAAAVSASPVDALADRRVEQRRSAGNQAIGRSPVTSGSSTSRSPRDARVVDSDAQRVASSGRLDRRPNDESSDKLPTPTSSVKPEMRQRPVASGGKPRRRPYSMVVPSSPSFFAVPSRVAADPFRAPLPPFHCPPPLNRYYQSVANLNSSSQFMPASLQQRQAPLLPPPPMHPAMLPPAAFYHPAFGPPRF